MRRKRRNTKWILFLLGFFLFSFFKCSPLAWGAPETKGLPFKFGGEVNFKLPFDPHHLSLKGKFKLFNFNLTGDIDLHIVSTSPLRLKFSSNKLFLRVRDLFYILNKLGYLPNPPSYIKGTCRVTGVSGTIEGQNYSLNIGTIKGPMIYGNLIQIKGGSFFYSQNKNLLKYKIASLRVGKSSFFNIEGAYSPKHVELTLKKMNLDLGSVLNTVYRIQPRLRTQILSMVQQYIPATSLSLTGNTYIHDVVVSLISRNTDKNASSSMVLKSLDMKIVDPSKMDISISLKSKDTPMHVFIIPGITSVKMEQNKIALQGHGFKIEGRNVFYPIEINQIKSRGINIPSLSIKNNFDISLPLGGNNTSVKIKGVVFPSPMNLYFRKNTYVKIASSPVQCNFEGNLLNFKVNRLQVTVPNHIYLNLNSPLGIMGDVSFEHILGDLFLGKKKSYNIGFNVNATKIDISQPLISVFIKKFDSYIGLTTEKLVLKGASADMVANKGRIVFSLDTTCPLQNKKLDYRRIYRNTKLMLSIQGVAIKDSKIDMLKIKKASSQRLSFQYLLHHGPIGIGSKGYVEEANKVISLITTYLKIKDNSSTISSKKASTSSSGKGFSVEEIPNTPIRISVPSFIPELSKHYHLELDSLSYSKGDREYDIDELKGDVLFKGDTTALSTEFYFCNLLFSGGMEIQKGTNVGAAFDIRAISMPIDHLLGCFITKAPVYVTGDTNIQVNLSTHGTTYREVVGNLSLDAFLRLDNGRILKLSNLGKKVEMILDVLSFVGLNPSKIEDALPFNKLIVSVSGGVKRLDIKQIEVISPILLFSSGGYFDLEKEKLHLSGTIKKSFLSKDFNLTTFLNGKKGK